MTVAIPPLPGPVPQASDPVNFDTRADALLTALPGTITAMNAQNAENNAINAGLPAMAAAAANAAAVAAVAVGMATKLNTESPSYTGSLTGGTGLVNLGNGQFVKDEAGNLGIGVTPSAWGTARKALQVGRASISDSTAASDVFELSTNRYLNAGSVDTYIDNGYATVYQQGGGAHRWFVAPSGTAGNPIGFTQAMTLDAGGNLLVGTTSSDGKLCVASSGSQSTLVLRNSSTAIGSYAEILFAPYTGTTAASAAIRNNYAQDNKSNLTFHTANTPTTPQERARITENGDLLVGATNNIWGARSAHVASGSQPALVAANTDTAGSSNPLLWCHAAGFDRLIVYGNGNVQNSNNSYGAFSDAKLKENITDVSPKLAKLMQVRIVNYTLKSDPSKAKLLGVIAQELEQVMPGLVEETPDFEDVTRTREVTKTVPVTEKALVPREQKTVEVVDGKAIVKTECLEVLADVPVVDHFPLFDAAGQPVVEVVTPEVPAVFDADGNVTQPAVAATYRQAVHSVPRMQEVTETETYTERVPTGTTTKAVKYSVFVPILIKALQEGYEAVQLMQQQLDAQNTAMQLLAERVAALEARP